MRKLLVLGFVVAAACGRGPAPAGPIEGRGGEGGKAISEDPVALLHVLAATAGIDDGAMLDSLIHPEHGAWLWTQPGAYVVPTTHLTAGGAAPPSQRFGPDDVNDYWREELWPTVAGLLARGLPVMDRDPADPRDPIYGTCDAEDGDGGGSAERTWLAAGSFSSYQEEVLAELGVEMPAVLKQDLVHYHQWGLDVWLMRADGRLWLAHLMVWTPCDA